MEKIKLMEIEGNNLHMDKKKLQKILFISNAIEDGWTVKKDKENYIFKKKHENKIEIYEKRYLEKFIAENSTVK
tara:strand:+ start:157 stop:378 length:222 start_codon:yes stop_codon:yes gene_type:complete